MVKIKICGITNLEDAKNSVDAGCDALGFIFYKRSPRYISPKKAQKIIEQLPSQVIKIGIFVNAKEKSVKRIAKICRLDMLQFQGNESPKFCSQFKDYKIIKAFRIKDKVNLKDIFRYKPFAYLFDTYDKSSFGGTGKSFNWNFLEHIAGLKQPVFLSGGLNKNNVMQAIETVHPDWVDVSSSLETRPGKKDHKKVREFIKLAKSRSGLVTYCN